MIISLPSKLYSVCYFLHRVVWNPHKSKAEAMSDFGSEQYNDMICVEPGLLSNVPKLEGGKRATFTQVMTSI